MQVDALPALVSTFPKWFSWSLAAEKATDNPAFELTICAKCHFYSFCGLITSTSEIQVIN